MKWIETKVAFYDGGKLFTTTGKQSILGYGFIALSITANCIVYANLH